MLDLVDLIELFRIELSEADIQMSFSVITHLNESLPFLLLAHSSLPSSLLFLLL